MSRPSQYCRPHDVIMAAEFVRLRGEAPLRWPFSEPYFYRLKNERRIKTYGSPATIKVAEFEAAMLAGFPVIDGHREAAA